MENYVIGLFLIHIHHVLLDLFVRTHHHLNVLRTSPGITQKIAEMIK